MAETRRFDSEVYKHTRVDVDYLADIGLTFEYDDIARCVDRCKLEHCPSKYLYNYVINYHTDTTTSLGLEDAPIGEWDNWFNVKLNISAKVVNRTIVFYPSLWARKDTWTYFKYTDANGDYIVKKVELPEFTNVKLMKKDVEFLVRMTLEKDAVVQDRRKEIRFKVDDTMKETIRSFIDICRKSGILSQPELAQGETLEEV